jgi:predicted nucleic acid-binding protein
MKLDDALIGVSRMGLDTPPVIYFVEAHPTYDSLVTEVFLRGSKGLFALITSVITLTEVLTGPIRSGDIHLQREYRNHLLYSTDFTTLSISPDIAERAAALRARFTLRTPDALQIATALEAGCEAFLTNDGALKRVTDLRILILDELEL